MPNESGNVLPFVAAACLCEKVLLEPDGAASLIRVIDTHNVELLGAVPEGGTPSVRLNLVVYVSLKSGDLAEEGKIGLTMRTGNKPPAPMGEWDGKLEGGVHGANMKLDLNLGATHGTHWIDVTWNGTRLTSIPLRVNITAKTPAQEE